MTTWSSNVPIAFSQAVLGATVTIETLDGDEQVEVRPGTSTRPGRADARARGSPTCAAGDAGELRVQFVVETPTDLTKEQEELAPALRRRAWRAVAPPWRGIVLQDPVRIRLTGRARCTSRAPGAERLAGPAS